MNNKKSKNLIRNAIKTLCIVDDNVNQLMQVSSFGEVKTVGKIGMYGLYANAPKGSLVTVMQINGQEECLGGFEDDVNNRPRGLKEGEVMVYNSLTKSYIYLNKENDVNIFANNGNVNVKCKKAIIDAEETALGVGGNAIVRLGDEVSVDVPTHGICKGTVTSASTKNTSI